MKTLNANKCYVCESPNTIHEKDNICESCLTELTEVNA